MRDESGVAGEGRFVDVLRLDVQRFLWPVYLIGLHIIIRGSFNLHRGL